MPSCHRSNTNKLTAKTLKKWVVVSGFYGFSFLVLVGGLGLCLTKPPAFQAQQYIVAAQYYQDHLNSAPLSASSTAYLLKQRHDALSKAASLTPYDPEIWKLLLGATQQKEMKAQASSAYLSSPALILSRNDLDTSRANK